MNELMFKYVALNFTVPDFYQEAKVCDYVYEATQLLQILIEVVESFQ